MGLDIRLPIGGLFLFIGVLLAVYGVSRPSASVSVGVNINLIWGAVLFLFGLVMLLLGRRGSRVSKTSELPSATPLRRGH